MRTKSIVPKKVGFLTRIKTAIWNDANKEARLTAAADARTVAGYTALGFLFTQLGNHVLLDLAIKALAVHAGVVLPAGPLTVSLTAQAILGSIATVLWLISLLLKCDFNSESKPKKKGQ